MNSCDCSVLSPAAARVLLARSIELGGHALDQLGGLHRARMRPPFQNPRNEWFEVGDLEREPNAHGRALQLLRRVPHARLYEGRLLAAELYDDSGSPCGIANMDPERTMQDVIDLEVRRQ